MVGAICSAQSQTECVASTYQLKFLLVRNKASTIDQFNYLKVGVEMETRKTYRSYRFEGWLWSLAKNGQHVRSATLTRILATSR